MIYLDNAATTLKKPPCVAEAVVRAMATMGNSGRSAHQEALDASRVIYRTREQLARLLGCSAAERVVFTCNSTEALNIAIDGLFAPGDHVLSTDCEHNSVLRPLYRLQGVELSVLPVKAEAGEERQAGILAYDELESLLRPNTKALIITHASNLTGNITDLERAAAFAKKHSLLLIVDAAQTAGTVPMDMERMGIDVLCFTGHKGLYGPQGTGGVCVRPGLSIRPLKVGGSGIHSFDREHPSEMPAALEAGTLNGHGIAGLGAAARWLLETGVEQIRAREQALLRRFVDGVKEVEGVTLYGNPDLNRRTGIQSLNIRDYDSARVADWLYEDYGIAVRGGAHCAPLMHEALGTREQGAVRFSFSYFNTEAEADEAAAAVRELAEE